MSLWAPPLEQPLVVTFVLEDGSPEVATGHHVMDRAGIFDPQRSGHGPILSHGARPEHRKPDPTPRSPLYLRGLPSSSRAGFSSLWHSGFIVGCTLIHTPHQPELEPFCQ